MPKRPPKPGTHRLQKVLADAGVAARRVCEQMIEAGRVTVNGEVVSRLPVFVNPHTDDIAVDGSRVSSKAERHLYVMLHKPERTLVTLADEPGAERRTVLDLVDHPAKARLFPVGRLDYDTTGLILLTNDGELAHRLTHPSFGIVKTYHAAVKGQIDDGLVAAVRTKLGLAHEANPSPHARESVLSGGKAERQPVQDIVILRREAGRTLIEISISEARNREIREVLRMLGAPVKRLSRVGIGTLTLRGLPVGAWRELTRDEVQMLRRSGPGQRPSSIRRPSASVPRKVSRVPRKRPIKTDEEAEQASRGDQGERRTASSRAPTRRSGTIPTEGRPPRSTEGNRVPERRPSRRGTGPATGRMSLLNKKPEPGSEGGISRSPRPISRSTGRFEDDRRRPESKPRQAVEGRDAGGDGQSPRGPKPRFKPGPKPASKPGPRDRPFGTGSKETHGSRRPAEGGPSRPARRPSGGASGGASGGSAFGRRRRTP